jgi:hypothetical protein
MAILLAPAAGLGAGGGQGGVGDWYLWLCTSHLLAARVLVVLFTGLVKWPGCHLYYIVDPAIQRAPAGSFCWMWLGSAQTWPGSSQDDHI